MSIGVRDKKRLLAWCRIFAGTSLVAIAYYLFLKPNEIMTPGLGGVAILVSYLVPLSLGLIYFLLNIPLFLLGYRFVGRQFVIRSLGGMISLSVFLYLFEFLPGWQQPVAGTLLGGVVSGVGIALVLLGGGTTGGVDIASVVIYKVWPAFTIGKCMMAINSLIVIASWLTTDALHSVYTLLSIFIAGKTIDICYTRWLGQGGDYPKEAESAS